MIENHGIKETSFYGHFVDPSDALEISVATRADDALVDASQWAHGGFGMGVEVARETIRCFLHRCWLKRLARVVRAFLRDRSISLNDRRASEAAVRECLTWASNSDWWE
jgi:hypothetical protein